MKNIFKYLLYLLLIISCENYYKNDFFEFLFNSTNINVVEECSNRPSLLSEGRSFEIYSMSDVNSKLVIKNIFDKSKLSQNKNYHQYKKPKWKKTPVFNKTDSVYYFIHNQMIDEKNTCFEEKTLNNILKQKGNFYVFLNDNLGRKKLFIWNVRNQKLYLLTSYEL